MFRYAFAFLCVLSIALAACGSQPKSPSPTAPSTIEAASPLRALATTTLVGDVVRQVGGDAIRLDVLLPVASDPHSFEPTPQDVLKLASTDVLFINGAGLETFLDRLISSADSQAKVVDASQGIQLLASQEAHEHEGEEHDEEHPAGDPHVWMDPNNVLIWVDNIERSLSELDAANAATYHANAQRYRQELQQLDAWIRQQVAQIPPANRKLVTDHLVFTYFAEEYGFTQVGAVIPGYSTLAEPSAQDLAALEDAIRELGVKAVFVGSTVNPALAQRVAQDTGVRLVFIYTGSLSQPGGEAATYLDFMRYNVRAIVEALR